MRPTIAPGELLQIEPLRCDRLHPGDVVAMLAADRSIVAHRLLQIGSGVLWTRGDATSECDAPWSAEQLLGRVAPGGALGRSIVRWPRLAPLLGAVGRIRRPGDAPRAVAALSLALFIRSRRHLVHFGRAFSGRRLVPQDVAPVPPNSPW